MDCRATARWLREADIAALAEPPRDVAAHLADCPTCAAIHDRQRQVVEMLGAVPEPVPPPELRERVRQALPRPRSAPLVRWLPAAAAVAVGMLLILGRQPEPAPVAVSVADLRPNSYLQQHLMTVGTDQLSDPTAMQALSVLALRAEQNHGRLEL